MHEMSLALGICDVCEEALVRHPGRRLAAVEVEVGAFAGVHAESLEFCLRAALAERFGNADCRIRVVPGQSVCRVCGTRFDVVRAPITCPRCGGPGAGLTGGDALLVRSLELE